MRLREIDFLRPILFIQLFLVHAFTIYTETSWPVPVGIVDVDSYDWIARLSYSCMLELFTFISGYVYYFVSTKKESSLGELFISKFKRLIVPSLVFSILYYWLLMDHREVGIKLIYNIICGQGHLWYLPMLFGCFIIAYFIKNTKKPGIFLIVACLISAFSRCPNVFRISQIAYYFFFFILGVFTCRYRHEALSVFKQNFTPLALSISTLFILSLVFLLPLNICLKEYSTDIWIEGYLMSALIRFINIVYSVIGIAFWFFISIRLSQCISTTPNWINQFNVLSMGVYIFHQFVLMFLYYYTPLPSVCGSFILPWVAILLTLPLSLLLSYLFRLSKFGKALM